MAADALNRRTPPNAEISSLMQDYIAPISRYMVGFPSKKESLIHWWRYPVVRLSLDYFGGGGTGGIPMESWMGADLHAARNLWNSRRVHANLEKASRQREFSEVGIRVAGSQGCNE